MKRKEKVKKNLRNSCSLPLKINLLLYCPLKSQRNSSKKRGRRSFPLPLSRGRFFLRTGKAEGARPPPGVSPLKRPSPGVNCFQKNASTFAASKWIHVKSLQFINKPLIILLETFFLKTVYAGLTSG